MPPRFAAASALVLSMFAGACATQEDARALRQPPLPPDRAVLASPSEQFYESIAIYEILGAPDHLFFEEGDLITTRPRRHQIHGALSSWLHDARLLSPSVRRSHYLLTVEFESLSGPDVWWFSDKSAGARVRYRLEETRSRETVFEGVYDGAFQSRMPGVTEEMVRAAVWNGLAGGLIVGGVNDMLDEANAQGAMLELGPITGLNGAAFGMSHEMLGWDRADVIDYGRPRVLSGVTRGAFTGAFAAALVENSDGNLTDFQASFIGGASAAGGAFLGAAPVGKWPDEWNAPTMVGAFDGARRREQAVAGMLQMTFNRFLQDLAARQHVRVRDAVPCEELNPYGRRGPALLVSTGERVAYDCFQPGAEQNPHPRASDLRRLEYERR